MSPSDLGRSPALEMRGVRKVFRQGGVELAVLNGVDLALEPGEIVALVGPSGAGKSTMLHVAGLLERPDGGAVLIDAGPGGSPDGFRVDVDGNLWCGWGMGSPELDGVRIFNSSGKPIGHIDLPERAANLCFGGRYRNRLFMTASHSLYALYVNTQGVAGG